MRQVGDRITPRKGGVGKKKPNLRPFKKPARRPQFGPSRARVKAEQPKAERKQLRQVRRVNEWNRINAERSRRAKRAEWGTADPAKIRKLAKQSTDLERAIDAALLAVPGTLGVKAVSKVAPRVARALRAERALPAERIARRAVRPASKVRVPRPTKAGAHRKASRVALQGAPFAAPAGPLAAAAIEGHVQANVGKSLRTTARTAPGFVTAPIGIAGNIALSGYRGTQDIGATLAGKKRPYSGKEVAAPTVDTAKSVYGYGKGLVETIGSGDPKKIKKAVESEYGYTAPLALGVPGLKGVGRLRKPKPKPKVREPEAGPVRRVGVRRRARREESIASATTRAGYNIATHDAAKPVIKAARKVTGRRGVIRRRNAITTPLEAVGVVAEEGINLRADPKTIRRQVANVRTRYGKRPEGHDFESSIYDVLDALEENPHWLSDPKLATVVDAFKDAAKGTERSPRAKRQQVAKTYDVPLPEERVPVPLRREAGGKTWTEASKKTSKAHVARVQRSARTHSRKREHDEQLLREFEGEVKAVERREGLAEPVIVHHTDLAREGGTPVLPRGPRKAVRKEHMRKGHLAESGRVSYRFEDLIRGSIAEPRQRAAMHEDTIRFVERASLPVGGRVIAKGSEIRAATRGQKPTYSPKAVAALPADQFKSAVKDKHLDLDAFTEDARRALEEQFDSRALEPDRNYILVERERLKERLSQMDRRSGLPTTISRGVSRSILYNPAWFIAQIVAESGQAAATVGPINLLRGRAALRGVPKAERQRLQAAAGSVPGAAGMARQERLSAFASANEGLGHALNTVERNVATRAGKSVVTGDWLGIADRWKGGEIRQAALAGHVNKELNGVLRKLSELHRTERALWNQLQGKPRHEQLTILANNPRALAKVQDYVIDALGEWSALTRYEKVAAPIAIFYPFMRMSLRWLTWAYPKRHPVKYAIGLQLAQWQADQLKEFLGRDPSFFTEWATAIVGGKPVSLARIAPGSNVVTEQAGEALSGKNLAGTLKALNPVAGAVVSGVTGVDPLSGKQVADTPSEQLGLAASILAGAPAPFRVPQVLTGPYERTGVPLLSKREMTALLRLSAKLRPKNEKAVRQFANPFSPFDSERFKDSAKLGDVLDRLGDTPDDSEIAKAKGDKKRLAALVPRLVRSQQAKDELHALYAKYHIGYREEEEQVKQAFKAVKGGKAAPKSDEWDFGPDRSKSKQPAAAGQWSF